MSDSVAMRSKFCVECGESVNPKAEICPSCGVRILGSPDKRISKVALLLITFFLGGFGGHKFYQKKYGIGVLYLLFFWTYIPGIIALIEFLIYCFKSEEELQRTYPVTNGAAIIFAIVIPLIAIVIIGILSAIAIPQFSSYRMKSYNSAAQSDIRNCRTQAEVHYSDYYQYPTARGEFACSASSGVAIYYLAISPEEFQIISFHESGDKAYLTNNESAEISINSKREIESQIASNFGANYLNVDFHFID